MEVVKLYFGKKWDHVSQFHYKKNIRNMILGYRTARKKNYSLQSRITVSFSVYNSHFRPNSITLKDFLKKNVYIELLGRKRVHVSQFGYKENVSNTIMDHGAIEKEKNYGFKFSLKLADSF